MNDQTKWFLDVANAFLDGLEAGLKSVKNNPPDYFQKVFEMDAEEIQKVDIWLKRNGGLKMNQFKFEMGAKVRDTITCFHGVVTARCEYHYGSVMYRVEKVNKDGLPVEAWFESGRLARSVV